MGLVGSGIIYLYGHLKLHDKQYTTRSHASWIRSLDKIYRLSKTYKTEWGFLFLKLMVSRDKLLRRSTIVAFFFFFTATYQFNHTPPALVLWAKCCLLYTVRQWIWMVWWTGEWRGRYCQLYTNI